MWPLNVTAATGLGNVTVSGGTYSDTVPFGSVPRCGIRFDTDNNVYRINTTGITVLQVSPLTDWLRPATAFGNYEIQATNAGPAGVAPGSAPLNTWLSLATVREWAVTRTGSSAGTSTAVLTISIRRALSVAVIDSGVYTLNAVRETP